MIMISRMKPSPQQIAYTRPSTHETGSGLGTLKGKTTYDTYNDNRYVRKWYLPSHRRDRGDGGLAARETDGKQPYLSLTSRRFPVMPNHYVNNDAESHIPNPQ